MDKSQPLPLLRPRLTGATDIWIHRALLGMCPFVSLEHWFVFPFAPVFGFLWHLLISPASLETLPETSATALPSLLLSLVPRTRKSSGRESGLGHWVGTGNLGGKQSCVLSYICAGVWRRWEGLSRLEVGQKAGVQEAGVEKAI